MTSQKKEINTYNFSLTINRIKYVPLIKLSNLLAFIKVAICDRFLFPNVNVYFQIKLHICFSRDEMKVGFELEKEFSSFTCP